MVPYDRVKTLLTGTCRSRSLFEDVDARLLASMQWATFDLNRALFGEPPARLLAAALRRGIEERVALLAPGESIHW